MGDASSPGVPITVQSVQQRRAIAMQLQASKAFHQWAEVSSLNTMKIVSKLFGNKKEDNGVMRKRNLKLDTFINIIYQKCIMQNFDKCNHMRPD